ncbi:TPM domain-containing protein [Neopusillimonas aromaticivorans]|uniref:TPM domain-containing protein n=1 Tax=Neopusillimonas aromaticivorans TaxID=2979868 RepID=UPI00259580DE|nr:YgcG family protein [Neopusillimonas aromaticivorans]WJJ95011.1 YgcG family protein [Neopusillimonas aromaticivorans]
MAVRAGIESLGLRWGLAAVLAVWLLLVAGPVAAQNISIPALQTRVTDTTGTLDAATVQSLEARLADLEKRKGAQVAVLMVPTTGDEAIEQYAVRAFEQWQLGRNKVDDGILLLVAKNDRALRIEVGYGLEGAVPDLVAGRIINEQIVPHFRDGDFAGGVVAGVDSLIARVNGEDLPEPEEASGAEDLEAFLLVALLAFITMPLVSALVAAGLVYLIWGSWLLALAGAAGMFLISTLFRAMRKGGGGGGRGGPGGPGGWADGGGGFGGGGFGGSGGFSGGGGRSGGGGSSGRW